MIFCLIDFPDCPPYVVDVRVHNRFTAANPPTVRDQFGGMFIYVGF